MGRLGGVVLGGWLVGVRNPNRLMATCYHTSSYRRQLPPSQSAPCFPLPFVRRRGLHGVRTQLRCQGPQFLRRRRRTPPRQALEDPACHVNSWRQPATLAGGNDLPPVFNGTILPTSGSPPWFFCLGQGKKKKKRVTRGAHAATLQRGPSLGQFLRDTAGKGRATICETSVIYFEARVLRMLRSYHHESTRSHQNSEVKRGWARLVLG